MTKSRNSRPKNSPAEPFNESTRKVRLCHVHDELDVDDRALDDLEKDRREVDRIDIRENVCVPDGDYPLTEFEGQHYCLFHLPSKEKKDAFNQHFEKRLEKIDQLCAQIEKEFPDEKEKQEAAKMERRIAYYFAYVWFPDEVRLGRTFSSNADFSSAQFTEVADFNSAQFNSELDFTSALFSAVVTFKSTRFAAAVLFNSAHFKGSSEFDSAHFNSEAHFRSAHFTEHLSFDSARFNSSSYFSFAQFGSYSCFRSANFAGPAHFIFTKFNGATEFNSAQFFATVDFDSTLFANAAYFDSTLFAALAKFDSTRFKAEASFNNAKFGGDAHYKEAKFADTANFRSVHFIAVANFAKTKFTSAANFNAVEFNADTVFDSSHFYGEVNFSSATFNERSLTSFDETRFRSMVRFFRAEVVGQIKFEGDVFCHAEKDSELTKVTPQERDEAKESGSKKEITIELPDTKRVCENAPVLDLRDVRLRNPERVSFGSSTLRPSWFVDAFETSKIEFGDVEWQNAEIDFTREGLDLEINSLETRKVPRHKESFRKALNRLADNAEANRRINEAKNFRKQGIALERKECHIHDETDLKKKADIREKVCRHYPVVNEAGGNYYCLWHNPDPNKAEVFLKAFESERKAFESDKAQQTDFRGVVFPITLEFSGEVPKLDFSGATFLRRVVFDQAEIEGLRFTDAFFTETSELVIKNSICASKIELDRAEIEGKISVAGKIAVKENIDRKCFKEMNGALSMRDARIDKPQRVNFRSLNLLPRYFVDVDASKFGFQDCEWNDGNGKSFDLGKEIAASTHKDIAQACNQLAINYEENRKYEESSVFRYAAMEANRLGNEARRWNFKLYWLYKWMSGYGESRLWATIVLAVLIGVFGFLYALPFAEFEKPKDAANSVTICNRYKVIGNPDGMSVCEGVIHSLAVASFQRPDPKPANALTKFLVTLETILAPLQAALLALAIRRKFMR